MLKTHNCGDLRVRDVGERVTLAGWVHRRRDHGGVTFIDLRDRAGVVQIVFRPDADGADASLAALPGVRGEYVLRVTGDVVERSEATKNANLGSGDVEVQATTLEILNEAKTPPFAISDDIEVDEMLRLQYRYVDLRRPAMVRALEMRHGMNQYIRDFMSSRAFTEVETPIMVAATPEGARDYLVPSRLHHGAFYALPQSPQQLKQLLMVGGLERYFQIARCFRDEDLRADRQPEFTQLDIEVSFVEEDDILTMMEEMFHGLSRTLRSDLHIPTPFPRLTYADVVERFGSDKPDLRYGLELADCSDLVRDSAFGVFRATIESGGRVRAVVMPGGASLSRKQVDEFTDLAKTMGAKGLVSIQFSAAPSDATADDVRSPVLRHLGIETVRAIGVRCDAKPGDLVLLAAGPDGLVNTVLDGLRRDIARRLDLADPQILQFAFITDFPMFEWDAGGRRWDALHHPFTAPHLDDLGTARQRPGAGARPRLRRHRQRLRAGLGLHPHPPARDAVAHFRPPGHRPGGAGGPLRPPAARLRVRRAAARRLRRWPRPRRHAADGRREHPRGHRLPEDPVRHRPPHRRPLVGARGAARGAGHPSGGPAGVMGGRIRLSPTPHA